MSKPVGIPSTRREVFVPADPRWTRPYLRVARASGGADWYCWATESGGGWVSIAGPPVFELRAVTRDPIEARRAASSETEAPDA